MKVGALDSHHRPPAPLRFIGSVVIKSRCLDISRRDVGPGRKINHVLEPSPRDARLIFLEHCKGVGVIREFIDAGEGTSGMIAPPIRPSRQAPVTVGENSLQTGEMNLCRARRDRSQEVFRRRPWSGHARAFSPPSLRLLWLQGCGQQGSAAPQAKEAPHSARTTPSTAATCQTSRGHPGHGRASPTPAADPQSASSLKHRPLPRLRARDQAELIVRLPRSARMACGIDV